MLELVSLFGCQPHLILTRIGRERFGAGLGFVVILIVLVNIVIVILVARTTKHTSSFQLT